MSHRPALELDDRAIQEVFLCIQPDQQERLVRVLASRALRLQPLPSPFTSIGSPEMLTMAIVLLKDIAGHEHELVALDELRSR